MKKLLPIIFLFALASCDKDKNEPIPYPDPAVLAKHQAPFGSPTVDVKLKKLLYNGKMFAEYVYEGDLLLEQKKFLLFDVPVHYESGSFVRKGGITESYEVSSADWNGESQSVSDIFKPAYSISFNPPVNDSLREITEENQVFLEIFYRTYAIDKQGFVTRQDFTEKTNTANDFTITYIRNEQHNVAKSWIKFAPQPDISNRVEYVYDNHPNPFFKLGLDRNGQMATHSLSPNNIVKETILGASGPLYSVDYKYEYAANGYPSKVTVESKNPAYTSYTLDFTY
ncbi:hypothetical protein [Dyadobacter sp. CY326]|uniref:hypothetical protein n=1 Tax=Dyadobacter sp. CY326 TaxID=2907300 RepID=UPI001F2229FF|nr:hypothetical protein [Dyadobacter sp. CY326]MCE7066102.1 hypothetical protein [Dyadobacter sp. CY326]